MRDEAGLLMASELWRLAQVPPQSRPHQLMQLDLSEREALAYDLTVMRAHDKAREVRWNLTMQAAATDDPTGMVRTISGIRLVYEDQ